MKQSTERIVKRWTNKDVDFLFANIHSMAIEDICKALGRNKRSVNLFLHRHRNDPRLITSDNMLLRILRLKFNDPELFNPTRSFLDSIKMGQKRFHQIYKGKTRMTDDECIRICKFFSIPFENIMNIRQTTIFDYDTSHITDLPNEISERPKAVQLNFLNETNN